MRQAAGLKQGFGKSWSAPSMMFRVEFCWAENDEESNEQIHWVECRNFQGRERKFLLLHYTAANEEWGENETLESKFVCVHVSNYLVKNKDRLHINRAFIFPSTKKGNETIRQPIYQINWTESLAANCNFEDKIMIVLNNSIYHHPLQKS